LDETGSSIRWRQVSDHLGKVKKPFQMLKGGYHIIRSGGAVTEIYGSKAKKRRFAKEDRRGHRSEFRKQAV
jgi:rRNA processing protein Gar1